jgi:CRISPR-associated endonuclease Cas1
MAAPETVTQSLQHCNFTEIVPRQGVVTLFGYGINVHVDRGHLTMRDGIASQRREGRLPRVGHGLKRLVVIGSDGSVSLSAFRWLADQRAAFVMLDRLGKVLVATGPVYPSDARLRRAQSLADDSGAAMRLAAELIRKKLFAQERLVRQQFHDEAAAQIIATQRHALKKANSKEDIRRFEAFGALAYWRAWHDLPVRFSQSDLQRVPNHWQFFGSRASSLTKSPRLAVSPPNAILNYIYAVLESEARLAISELGLDPGIGVLHNDTRTRDSLACDLMEPIRPQVDAFVLDWLRREPLQRKWFFEERNGNCRLTGQFSSMLSETSKLWRQALSPLAEWVAHELWNVTSRAPREKAPATRLTQNRKRETKGIPPIGQDVQMIRENHLMLPKPLRVNASDPIAQLRRAAGQKKQTVALKKWVRSEKPDWLDDKFFHQQIQPRLQSVKASDIQAALSVSQSYAMRIGACACEPHQRHWFSLARLVGVVSA